MHNIYYKIYETMADNYCNKIVQDQHWYRINMQTNGQLFHKLHDCICLSYRVLLHRALLNIKK